MNIKNITIHNFRSVLDGKFNLDNYTLLVGENNAGKTTIVTAIRIFYEDNGAKFIESRDFPKIITNDNESWVEIEYKISDEEKENLKEEYKNSDNTLKIRKFFKSTTKEYTGNLYAYVNGELTFENQFYGETNIGKKKLGKVLYVPAFSKTDDGLKLTGPSYLRNIIEFVFEKAIEGTVTYDNLKKAFDIFNSEVNKEDEEKEFSFSNLSTDVNTELNQFGLGFKLDVNPIKPNDIVKNLIQHTFTDDNLNNKIDDVSTLGQGVQRHLIYTLIKLSVKYSDKKKEKKKDFSPNFTLLLFEEPEAFLHPSQQEQLNLNLKILSSQEEQQVLITTHSPTFVSKNTQDIKGIVRVNKINGISQINQLDEEELNSLFNDNLGLYSHFCNLIKTTEEPALKKKYLKLGSEVPDLIKKLEEETLRFFLWLDTERASLFFAKHIVICEGASEKIFLDLLVNEKWNELKSQHIYFLDALGKYNIHRYLNLFGRLGIKHSVLMDKDKDAEIHYEINNFINNQKNELTFKIDTFEEDIEVFLGIEKPSKDKANLKPLNIIMNYQSGKIEEAKLTELRTKITNLLTQNA
jgi:predicted ATP-dependent endonuclease of OLD family